MKQRYCIPCDQLTNANPCPDCGADTNRWSETDREYQRQARRLSPAQQMREHLDEFGKDK